MDDAPQSWLRATAHTPIQIHINLHSQFMQFELRRLYALRWFRGHEKVPGFGQQVPLVATRSPLFFGHEESRHPSLNYPPERLLGGDEAVLPTASPTERCINGIGGEYIHVHAPSRGRQIQSSRRDLWDDAQEE